jgi:hypothetical protein
MTQLSIAVTSQPPRRPSPRRPSPRRGSLDESRRERARLRLLAEAAQILPWPRDVVRDVVLSGTLAENLAALHVVDGELRELERHAQLVEDPS